MTDTKVSFEIEESEYNQLKNIAKKNRMTVDQLINEIIKNKLEERTVIWDDDRPSGAV